MSIDLLLHHLQTGLVSRPPDIVSWAFNILILLALAGVVVALATDDRDPSTVLAWLFVIMLLPVIGIIAYFFIGRNYRRASKRRTAMMQRLAALAEQSLAPTVAASAAFTEATLGELRGTPAQHIESAGRREDGVAPLPADTVDIYTAGSQKFPALLDEMATAEKYIHLMYLIWEQDELTGKVTDVLLDRLSAGVQVHIIYDWLSCISYKKDELKKLSAAGAVVVPCFKRLPQINYRNHRKIVVIDGGSLYTRRHEHGPGVHRRRPRVRRVARHHVRASGSARRRPTAPVRDTLDRRAARPLHRVLSPSRVSTRPARVLGTVVLGPERRHVARPSATSSSSP